MYEETLMLLLIIRQPHSPSREINMFLHPLIDEKKDI